MLKYDEYILENKLVELLLEAKVTFRRDFWTLIKRLKDSGNRIAGELLSLDSTDVNIQQNIISLSDDNDKINIISDTRKQKYALIHSDYIYRRDRRLIQYGFVFPTGDYPPVNTEGFIINVTPYPGIPNRYIARFQVDGGEIWNVEPNGLVEIPLKLTSISVGRFAVKILTAAKVSYTAKEIEDFVNTFKAEYDATHSNAFRHFYLVSGEDIRKYYFETNYEMPRKGSIWNSCMRYDRCQLYLDIYVKNPDKVSMLVLLGTQDKVKGRALIWKLDSPSGVTFMDRIYTKNDNDINLFRMYAKENGWITKTTQTNNITDINLPGDAHISVNLDNFEFDYYPYMDTLCYMTKDGVLNNGFETSYYRMRGTGGQEYFCSECDSTGYSRCECDDDDDDCDCERVRCEYCAIVDRGF